MIEYGAVEGYGPIFNAGVVFHDGRFHMFARGVRDCYRRNVGPGPRFVDYVSDVLVFVSNDGRSYEFQQVLAEASSGNVWCFEDPRVQTVRSDGDEHFVMTYTNLPPQDGGLPWRIGVHRLGYADGRFFVEQETGRVIGPDGQPNKDAVVFNLSDGRVALIHRIYPNMQLAVFDSLEQMLYDPRRLLGRASRRSQSARDHRARARFLRRRCRRAADRNSRTVCSCSTTSEAGTPIT